MSSSHLNIRVLVDFDGTMVPGDVTDHIYASFCDPKWLDLEAEWQSGRMTSRECMSRQVDMIRANPEDIARAVNERTIDPDFPAFVKKAQASGIDIIVVSDGFDIAIETVLKRNGLDLPYYANRLEWLGRDRWRLGFPNMKAECAPRAGNCKCAQLADGARRTVVIGDGRSDFCVASKADFILSKASLTRQCVEKNFRHIAIGGFADVLRLFDTWTMEALMAPRRQTMPRLPVGVRSTNDMSKRPPQLH